MITKDIALSEKPYMGDRVSEVYLGVLGKSIQYKKTKSRIDWMAENMHGERALDIGCSQGILELLLARNSFYILAIDLDYVAITYAKKQLNLESPDIQQRVEYRHIDFSIQSFPEANFDTVYLCEVIEHSQDPKQVIEKAVAKLRTGGHLILTTPYGLLPHDDHLHIFCLDNLIEIMPENLHFIELDVVDGYIRLISMKTKEKSERPNIEVLFTISNKSLIERQRFFYDLIKRKQKKITKLENLVTKQNFEIEKIRNVNHENTNELKKLNKLRSIQENEIKSVKSNLNKILKSKTYQAGKRLAFAYRNPWPNLFLLPLQFIELKFGLKRFLSKFQKLKNIFRFNNQKIFINNDFSIDKKKPTYTNYEPYKTNHEVQHKVAVILDEFSENCLKYEWDLVLLKKDEWKNQIDIEKPLFLFVESAWRGNRGEWNYLISKYKNKKDNPIRDLLAFCKKEGIPTVFWNKEDPPNFDVFIDAAKEFDYIFTTDSECITKYKEHCSHNQIYELPFAAQPVIHNPTMRHESDQRQIAFGGGWYSEKHSAREKYLPMLIDAAIENNLNFSIFDRFSDLKDNTKHRFPSRYNTYLRPKLPYEKMLSAYRMFPLFLNVNSVTNSNTMFSRRVFELMACGTITISSPSIGMQKIFGDLVPVARNFDEAKKFISKFHKEKDLRSKYSHLGYRLVMNHHTYKHRTNTIMKRLFPDLDKNTEPPLVSVVLTTNRPQYLRNCKENYIRQRYKNKELLLVLNSDKFEREEVKSLFKNVERVKIFQFPENKNLPFCLNHVLSYVDGKYWAKFDDDDLYGPMYLSDSLLPFCYTDASLVGKGTYYAKIQGNENLFLRSISKEHKYANIVCGGTFVVDTKIMKKVAFDESIDRGSDTAFLRSVKEAGYKIYSSDRYNFVQIRNNQNGCHTWNISLKEYLSKCKKACNYYDEDIVMI